MTKKLSACPGWLDLSQDRRSFVFVPQKAEIVRKIFDLCIAGLGSYSIAKQLERENVQAFGSSGKWDNTTIDNLLRSRAVLGEYQPKSYAGGSKKGVPVGEPVPNYYPAVVDERVFAEAQRARQRHLASGRGRKGNGIANLFSGLTTCAYPPQQSNRIFDDSDVAGAAVVLSLLGLPLSCRGEMDRLFYISPSLQQSSDGSLRLLSWHSSNQDQPSSLAVLMATCLYISPTASRLRAEKESFQWQESVDRDRMLTTNAEPMVTVQKHKWAPSVLTSSDVSDNAACIVDLRIIRPDASH